LVKVLFGLFLVEPFEVFQEFRMELTGKKKEFVTTLFKPTIEIENDKEIVVYMHLFFYSSATF